MKTFSSQLIARVTGRGQTVRDSKGRVEGKVAIVTGAGGALGKAIASALVREGAKVMLTDIDEQTAAASAEEICNNPTFATSMQQDVSDEKQWDAVVAKTRELYGGLHVLVNNAGVAKLTDIDNFNSDDMRQTFAVNVEGSFFGMVSAIALMKGADGGSIINISSVGGIIALPGLASYCASKAAVRQLTKCMAIECARKKYPIRVNSVHPGFVPTASSIADITKLTGLSEQGAIDEITTTVPMGRPGTPEEIANGVLFLASDESGFMTGSELVMDGGVSAA